MCFLLYFASIIVVLNLTSADAKSKRQLPVDDSDDLTAPLSPNPSDLDTFNWDLSSQDLSDPNLDIFADATPQSSTCVGQEIIPMNEPSYLIARDILCPQPLPLSPESLQLFEDPTAALDRILPQNSEGGSSIDKDYPSLLTPDEQREKNESPGADIDYEVWQDFRGTVNYEGRDPCEIDKLSGFPHALCCGGPFQRDDDSYMLIVEYTWVAGCDPYVGQFFDRNHFFKIYIFFCK